MYRVAKFAATFVLISEKFVRGRPVIVIQLPMKSMYVYGMENHDPKRIGYLLERTTRIIKLSYSQSFKSSGFDITPEQWVILESLFYKNAQSQNDLAEFSFKDAPTISRILDLLCNKGYTIREEVAADKRARKITLTDQGYQLVTNMQPLVDELREQGWMELTDEDHETLVRIVDQVFKNYND